MVKNVFLYALLVSSFSAIRCGFLNRLTLEHKMKKIVMTLIFLLPTLCFSQADLSKVKIIYGAENEIIPEKGDTIREYHEATRMIKSIKYCDSGYFTILQFSDRGQIMQATVFPIENLKYKTLTKFHENGNIILIANYDRGIVTGELKKYYDNGNLMETGAYSMMKKVGKWEYYNENGDLLKIETYNNGKLIDVKE